MGCYEAKNSRNNFPILTCIFELGNETQKQYCLKFKDNFTHEQTIRYEINSYPNSTFSITFQFKGITHQIQDYFDENEMDNSLQKIYDILDKEQEKEDNININAEIKEEIANELKQKVLNNQQMQREIKPTLEEIPDKEKNEQINNVLEDMCIYGTITKQEIKEEKKKHPEKFIETSQALKMENDNQGIFALGLLSNNLEELGIETAIEKEGNSDDNNAGLTFVQFLSNGMINKKKYDLHFEFGEQRNNELLNDKKEFEKFKENLKLKLSKDYNISPEKIIVTLPQKGSFHVQVIFQSDEFNNLDKKQFIEKFKNDPDFEELSNLKDIQQEVIMGGVKLRADMLDSEGNRNDGQGIGEQRGGKDYDPPIGWNGIGLKVKGKFDNGDDTWIGMENSTGEWCVAYHGVATGQSSDKVKDITGKIVTTEFRPGWRQAHSTCDDQFHPGKKVGDGVYCTPTIKTAEMYAGESNINGINYKTVLMVRVKPSALRHCDTCSDSRAPYNYWVVNGTTDEIRPYRILYKRC